MAVPRSDAKILARYREFEGLPDLDVSKVAKCVALSPSFATAIDIGAHVGAVSVYLSRKFSKVLAFEAIPSTYAYLQENTAQIGNIEALNMAVGPEEGDVYFDHYSKHGQLSHVSGNPVAHTERVGPIRVRTIDSFNVSDVSFIKIDVEGYELPVLEGASDTITRCQPLILLEQAGNDELHFNRPRNEASEFLEQLGMHQHSAAPKIGKDRLYTF